MFGHTHEPKYMDMGDGKYYLNDGTWIDNNTDYPEANRTFAVITTGEKDTAALYKFAEDGTVVDISSCVSKTEDEATSADDSSDNVKFDYKTLENYGDESAQARYVEVSGLADSNIQSKLNEETLSIRLLSVFLSNNCPADKPAASTKRTAHISPLNG